MKKIAGYLLLLSFFISATLFIITHAPASAQLNKVTAVEQGSALSATVLRMKKHLADPAGILILQIILLIAASRLAGWIFGRIGQPVVIGEIIAGIILGPTLLGTYFPQAHAFIFPAQSMDGLKALSQVGLILYMFIVGLELDAFTIKRKLDQAVLISHSGIFIQFVIGAGAAWFFYDRFAPAGVPFTSFALFLGIALSITAFPVLSRIIRERGYMNHSAGKLALATAASDDVTAWSLLALVIALIDAASASSLAMILGLITLYVGFMILVAQPLLSRAGELFGNRENLGKPVVAFIFLYLFVSSFVSNLLGIHLLFGAFLAGAVFPDNSKLRALITEKIEDISVAVLLPLFFAFAGLRTQIGLLNTPELWKICALFIVLAMAGKVGAVYIASRLTGSSRQHSAILAVMMNTRGLMELIVINIGYDLGIINAEIFAILVIVALTTTFMTGPLLSLIEWLISKRDKLRRRTSEKEEKIMISFGQPRMGLLLLKTADALAGRSKSAAFTAVHLTPDSEITKAEAETFERQNFAAVRAWAKENFLPLECIYKPASDIPREISRIARKERINLLLMGGARTLFSDDVTGGKVRRILHSTGVSAGILVEKDMKECRKAVFIAGKKSASPFLQLARGFLKRRGGRVTFVDLENSTIKRADLREAALELGESPGFELLRSSHADMDILDEHDLVVVSIHRFRADERLRLKLSNSKASVLILRLV